MKRFLSSAMLAIALASTGAPIGTASADDLEFQLGPDGPQLLLRDNDCNPRRERCGGDRWDRDGRDGDRWDRERWSARRQCTAGRALDKAERMGIRRARIDDIGRRTIDVRGRTRDGERVIVTFDRWDRRCRVIG
jgi:hypothetical protein